MQLTTVQEVINFFPKLDIEPSGNNKIYVRDINAIYELPLDSEKLEEVIKPQHERAADLTRKLYESSIKLIDEKNGDGYARKNPNLLGNVLNTHRSMYLTLEENAKK